MSKQINDLTLKKNTKLGLMKKIVADCIYEERKKTTSEQNAYNDLDQEVKILEREIANLQAEEDINLRSKTGIVRTNDNNASFRDWLNRYISGETKEKYVVSFREERADPFLSTTDTGVINKEVANIDQLVTPSETLLRNLGVKFYSPKGNLSLPKLNESVGGWVNEAADGSTANLATTSITLSARPVTHSQSITRATIEQSTDVVNAIVYNLVNGIWKAVAQKFFDELEVDCAGQVYTIPVTQSAISFTDIVNMEASLGGVELIRPSYVMQPQTKAYLKRTTKLANAQNSIWEADTVNEYPAYATPHANKEKVYFGDFSKAVISNFGGISIVVDPYSKAASQEIVFTAQGLFDMGIHNKDAFCVLVNASTY